MNILTARQMARCDRLSIKKHGISAQQLMANAAARCGEALLEQVNPKKSSRIVIVSGPGNNGGDGFALAGWLAERGFKPRVFFCGTSDKLSEEAKFFKKKVADIVLPLHSLAELKKFKGMLRHASILVDALFGIGLKRPIQGLFRQVVAAMNRCEAFKMAVDMPSGLSADTGQVLGVAFRADLTVTFERPKWGQILEPAWDYVGQLVVKPIGLSLTEVRRIKSSLQWLEADALRNSLPARKKSTHKGRCGEVLVIAGSKTMPGAGYLCAIAALRAGAGLVRWAFPGQVRFANLKYPEVMLLPVAEAAGAFAAASLNDLKPQLPQVQAVALGPGLGQAATTLQFIEVWLRQKFRPMVLDADALNLIAQRPALLSMLRGCILTPHPKEMARLCGLQVQEVLQDRIKIARKFAKKNGVILVLKGYRSVIAGPQGEIFLNASGGPYLATAGSGDVLTGVIAGLLAQGMKPLKAALAATYWHGRAGDLLAKRYGDRGILASDVAKQIPLAIQESRSRGGQG